MQITRHNAAFALPLAAAFSLAAAASASDSNADSSSQAATATMRPSTSSSRGESSTRATRIRVVVGNRVFTARLWDNATARSLIAQLPLTLSFSDLNGVEKIGRLRKRLSMRGMPKSADPAPREIGYYAPSNDLVFYYGDVGRWNGIARIGRFDGSIAAIRNQRGAFTARIEVAGRGR